jgi:hypothetical protein
MKRNVTRIAVLTNILIVTSILPAYAETCTGDSNLLQNRLLATNDTLGQKESEKQPKEKTDTITALDQKLHVTLSEIKEAMKEKALSKNMLKAFFPCCEKVLNIVTPVLT